MICLHHFNPKVLQCQEVLRYNSSANRYDLCKNVPVSVLTTNNDDDDVEYVGYKLLAAWDHFWWYQYRDISTNGLQS